VDDSRRSLRPAVPPDPGPTNPFPDESPADQRERLLVKLLFAAHRLAASNYIWGGNPTASICRECGVPEPLDGPGRHAGTCSTGEVLLALHQLMSLTVSQTRESFKVELSGANVRYRLGVDQAAPGSLDRSIIAPAFATASDLGVCPKCGSSAGEWSAAQGSADSVDLSQLGLNQIVGWGQDGRATLYTHRCEDFWECAAEYPAAEAGGAL